MMAALIAPIDVPAIQSGWFRPRQGLVNSGLIGSERTAALQHQGDAFEANTPFRHCDMPLGRNIHGWFSISLSRWP